jgi:DMSO reductase anchor subunit
MVATTLHLGRWDRAYRAILNWRGSWLSREIILVSAFIGLSTLWLLTGAGGEAGRAFAVLVGLAALFSIDRVYHVTGTHGLNAHSAQTLLTGFFFVSLFGGDPLRAGVVGAIKLALYVARKQRFASHRLPFRPALSALRITLGMLVPVVLWAAMLRSGNAGALWPAIVAAVIAGEVIDRCEFYMELDVPTLPAVSERDLRVTIPESPRAGA